MELNNLGAIQLCLFAIWGCCVCSMGRADQCFWKESSSVTSAGPTVMKMKTECTRGKIQWVKPFGGLRATFYPKGIEKIRNKSFKVCFKATFTGVSIYSDEYTKLKLLKSANNKRIGETLCVSSGGEPVVLYLEKSEANKDVITIAYTVRFQQKRIKQRLEKECKPCGSLTLLKSLCTSDFVVKGRIISTIQLDGRTVQAEVLAKELLRQTANIFVREKGKMFASPIGSVQFPSNCKWNRNKVHLFTGNIVSGRGPVLGCHVKESIWMKLKKQHISHLCKYVYGVPRVSGNETIKH